MKCPSCGWVMEEDYDVDRGVCYVCNACGIEIYEEPKVVGCFRKDFKMVAWKFCMTCKDLKECEEEARK